MNWSEQFKFECGTIMWVLSWLMLLMAFTVGYLVKAKSQSRLLEITEYTYLWPEVFTNPDFIYEGPDAKPRAVADGLSGWGCCCAGAKIPPYFGQAMLKIGKVLGIVATPENLQSLADEFLEEGDIE